LPGAYAGSICGRRLSGKPFSTIGFERRHNAAFRIDAASEFVEFILQDSPPAPVGAAENRAWNSGHRVAAAE
jgi:hydroxyacylglutathione hydrolase